MTLTDYWTSLVRTGVPIIVGALLASRFGPFISPDAATEFVTAGFAVVYYAAVRSAEHLFGGQVGWFLGSPRAPVYDVDTGDLAAVPEWDRADVDGEAL